jgi:hypothetical protein
MNCKGNSKILFAKTRTAAAGGALWTIFYETKYSKVNYSSNFTICIIFLQMLLL